MPKPIIDVSEHQGEIDWAEASKHISGAVIRLSSWRLSSGGNRVDKQAEANIEGALTHGVPTVGGYIRALPWANSPESEWALFQHWMDGFGMIEPGRFIPAIDIEPTDDPARDATVDWPEWKRDFIHCWVDYNSAIGGKLRDYGSGSYFDTKYGGVLDLPLSVTMWAGHTNEWAPGKPTAEAWAGKTPYTFGGRTTMHQYSHKGSIPGITGDVDLNVLMPYTTMEEVTL